MDVTTFKMRFFPLEPRQEKRLVLSYVQRLPGLYSQSWYRFPAGHSLERVAQWSFEARVKKGAGLACASPSHEMKTREDGQDLILEANEKNATLDRDVVLNIGDTETHTGAATTFRTAELDGTKYLMLRYRPALQGEAKRERRDWLFLFETSGDRDPLLARTQIEVIRGLLQQCNEDDTFRILTANTRVRAFSDKAESITPQKIEEAISFLEKSHLIGALDLDQALMQSAKALSESSDPWLVHVGSGVAAMGEHRHDQLVKRLPEKVKYVGVGVGRKWNRGLMKLAAERSGGYFTQINPDE